MEQHLLSDTSYTHSDQVSPEVAPSAQSEIAHDIENERDDELLRSPAIALALCVEGKRKVIRYIRELSFTLKRVQKLYVKASRHQTIFWNDLIDFDTFTSIFFRQEKDGSISPNGLVYVVDDFVGFIFVTDIRPNIDATVHFAFFDKRMTGREDLAKEFIKHLFEQYNFHRLSCSVACYANNRLYNFIYAIGFKDEGRKRQCLWHGNQWWDARLFYLLKENFNG